MVRASVSTQGSKREVLLPLRVFLVEDSPLFRERMAEHLLVPGRIEIVGYADAEKPALSALRLGAWDALILDLQLKSGSGLGILKALRDIGRPPDTKVIVLTNHDYFLYRLKSTEFGADHFFDKGRQFHRVIEVLEEMASARQIPNC